MKEDYKEEAKRFLENRKQYDGSVDHFEKGDFIQRTSDLMVFFHLHMIETTRYHPDTLEPVEKPVDCGECDGINKPINSKCGACWGTDYSIIWNNALTLEQVFERYKEMKKRISLLEAIINEGLGEEDLKID